MRPTSLIPGGLAAGLTVLLGFTAACGDDDDVDQSAVCAAREDLDEDVQELGDIDLSDTSVDEVTDIVGDIRDQLGDLSTAAEAELGPEVDDLRASLDNLNDTIGDLGSSDSLGEAGDSLRDALDDVRSAVDALRDEASEDCPT